MMSRTNTGPEEGRKSSSECRTYMYSSTVTCATTTRSRPSSARPASAKGNTSRKIHTRPSSAHPFSCTDPASRPTSAKAQQSPHGATALGDLETVRSESSLTSSHELEESKAELEQFIAAQEKFKEYELHHEPRREPAVLKQQIAPAWQPPKHNYSVVKDHKFYRREGFLWSDAEHIHVPASRRHLVVAKQEKKGVAENKQYENWVRAQEEHFDARRRDLVLQKRTDGMQKMYIQKARRAHLEMQAGVHNKELNDIHTLPEHVQQVILNEARKPREKQLTTQQQRYKFLLERPDLQAQNEDHFHRKCVKEQQEALAEQEAFRERRLESRAAIQERMARRKELEQRSKQHQKHAWTWEVDDNGVPVGT